MLTTGKSLMQAVDGAYVGVQFEARVDKGRIADVIATDARAYGFELVDCQYDRFGFRDVVQYQPGVCLYGEHRPEIRGRIPEFP